MKALTSILAYGENLRVLETEYRSGGLAIVLEDEQGGPWGTVTVNLPGTELEEGEFLVKTWGENEPYRQPLLDSGFFQDTGKRVPTGFVMAEVWTKAQVH